LKRRCAGAERRAAFLELNLTATGFVVTMRPMSTPVTLERYAEIRAEMDAGTLRDEVLARTGITIDEWSDTQDAWLEKMGTDLERGRFELTNRYTQAFLERQRALRVTASPDAPAVSAPVATPTTAPLPPLVTPPSLPFTPLPPPPAVVPPVAPPPIEDMLLEAHLPRPAGTEMADDPARTLSTPFVAVEREVLPFKTGPLDPDAPDLSTAPADFDACATQPFDRGRLVAKDVLPFTGASSNLRSTLRSEDEEPAFDQDRPSTNTAEAPLAKAGPTLPFVTPTEALRETWTSPSPPNRSAHPPDRGSLPFLQGAAAPSVSEPARPSSELPSGQPTEEMKQLQGITLSHYAQLCATVRASPDHVAQIRSYYGIDAHAWVALHTLWQERFQRDPALRARWQVLVETALSRPT
jgi:hypothetical protein